MEIKIFIICFIVVFVLAFYLGENIEQNKRLKHIFRSKEKYKKNNINTKQELIKRLKKNEF